MISFVIPSYNRAEGMIELIETIYAQRNTEIEIIVVDDCSPDNSNELIESTFPEVFLLKNEINSGPAISRHKGILAANGDIVIGLDSDVLIKDKDLSNKVYQCFQENDDVSMLAFKLLTPNGDDDSQRWWHSKPLATHSNESFETAYFSGTGYAIKKQAYINSGGFSDLLYMHYEEVLLSYRVIDAGYKIVYSPELVVIHNATPNERRNKMKMFYKPRNQLIVAAVSMPVAKILTYVIPRMAKNFITAIRENELKEYLLAIRDFIKKRKLIQRQRKVLKPATFSYINSLSK